MEKINQTNSYTMYKGNLNGEKYIVAISNTINKEIEINVKFNNNLAVVEANKCYISITNNNIPLETIKNIIIQTYKDLTLLGYTKFASQIKIIVDTKEEHLLADKFANERSLNLNSAIEESPKYVEQEQVKDTEEKLKNFMTTKTITKEDNGIMKKFIIRKEDDRNIGYLVDASLISDNELYNTLIELKHQGLEEEKMSEEELANLVIDRISEVKNLKRFSLETSDKQSDLTNQAQVAGTVAAVTEGTVNKEAGIVIPGAGNTNIEGYAVEQDGNKTNVVAAQMTTSNTMEDGKTNTISSTPSYSFNHQSNGAYNASNNNTFSQQEDIPLTGIYYKEDTETQSKENANVKRLVKKPNQSGMISLPIIIFILSGILLIASAVIFFITK